MFVRFEPHTFPFMGDYFPFMGDYFPLKGHNFHLIGITFRHDKIPSMEENFHFNGSVGGIKFSLKVTIFHPETLQRRILSVHRN